MMWESGSASVGGKGSTPAHRPRAQHLSALCLTTRPSHTDIQLAWHHPRTCTPAALVPAQITRQASAVPSGAMHCAGAGAVWGAFLSGSGAYGTGAECTSARITQPNRGCFGGCKLRRQRLDVLYNRAGGFKVRPIFSPPPPLYLAWLGGCQVGVACVVARLPLARPCSIVFGFLELSLPSCPLARARLGWPPQAKLDHYLPRTSTFFFCY